VLLCARVGQLICTSLFDGKASDRRSAANSSSAADQDISAVQLSRRGVAQSDLSTGHFEEFFTAEVPTSLLRAPGIVVSCLVPPMRFVFDREDCRERSTAVAARRLLSLREWWALLIANRGIKHIYASASAISGRPARQSSADTQGVHEPCVAMQTARKKARLGIDRRLLEGRDPLVVGRCQPGPSIPLVRDNPVQAGGRSCLDVEQALVALDGPLLDATGESLGSEARP